MKFLALLTFLIAPLAHATGLLLPCYGNTTVQFTAAIEAAKTLPVIAILNPDDGVGTRRDNFIADKAAELKAAGAQVIGYIATGYGTTSIGQVRLQMDNYVRWYGVTGVFLDEMAGIPSKLNYYRSLRNLALIKHLTVVGNPGQGAAAGYATVTDVLVTYEDAYSDGFNRFTQPQWTSTLPATRLAAIVHSAPANVLNSIIDRTLTQRYGWVYVTDKKEPDPYGLCAAYQAAEVAYLKVKNDVVLPAQE